MDCLFVPKQWMNIYKENENIICSKSLRLWSWKVFIKIGAFWLPYFSEVWCLSPIFWLWNCSLTNSECPVLDTLTVSHIRVELLILEIKFIILERTYLLLLWIYVFVFPKKDVFTRPKARKWMISFFFPYLMCFSCHCRFKLLALL